MEKTSFLKISVQKFGVAIALAIGLFAVSSVEIKAQEDDKPRESAPVVREESPRVEIQRSEPPRVESPRVESPRVESPREQRTEVESPRQERQRDESPRAERSRQESPAEITPSRPENRSSGRVNEPSPVEQTPTSPSEDRPRPKPSNTDQPTQPTIPSRGNEGSRDDERRRRRNYRNRPYYVYPGSIYGYPSSKSSTVINNGIIIVPTSNVPQNQGFRDGFLNGAQDGLTKKEFAPQKNSYFKRATNGYDSQYGSKNSYQEQYRRAFLRGYEAGYSNPNGDPTPPTDDNSTQIPPK